jgi:hypothetical protein
VGCAPDGPAKCLRVLGRYRLETFLRSACLGWPCQTLCSYARYLDVSTLHTFKIDVISPASSSTDYGHLNFCHDVIDNLLHATHLSGSCWVSSDTGHRRFETSLRSACLQGLLEVGPARFLAAMLGDLGLSTPRSIKTMTQFSSLLGASNQSCCLLQCSGTTLRVRLRRPLVFLVVPTCWETCFSSRRYST